MIRKLLLPLALLSFYFTNGQQSVLKPASFGKIKGTVNESSAARSNTTERGDIDLSNAKAILPKDFSWSKVNQNNLRTAQTQGASSSANNPWLSAEPPLIVQPSPTASSIINQSKESVDLYTGKVSASIPLYVLKSKDIELPITLSYNSAGVKVDEISSWVGMSWSLQLGGCISRVMKGLPDEFSGGKVKPFSYAVPNGAGINAFGYINIKNRDDGVVLANFSTYNDTKKKKIIRNADWISSLDGLDYGDGLGFGEAWDTEPDEFHFSFGKYSGSFVFDQDGNIQFLSNQNFKISKTIKNYVENGETISKIVSFTIYTDDGYKYSFGDDNLNSVERTQNFSMRRTFNYLYVPQCQGPDGYCYYPSSNTSDPLYRSYLWYRYPIINLVNKGSQTVPDVVDASSISSLFTSTWYLTEIQSPNGDKMTFNYSKPQYALGYVQSQDERVKMPNLAEIELFDFSKNPPESLGWFFISPPGDNTFSRQEVTFSRNEVVIDNRFLSSIVSSDGDWVEFLPQSTTRLDNLGDLALEFMNIYDSKNSKVKAYNFHYEYQAPAAFTGAVEYFTDPVNLYSFLEYDDPALLQRVYSEQRRLFLTNLTELSRSETVTNHAIPSYQFIYDSQVLPRRNGYKQDKWGYYNGNLRGTKMPPISYLGLDHLTVPRSGISIMRWFITPAEQPSYLGADVSPNETLAQAGILKKIIYPTGGAKEFLYELNKVSTTNVGGLRVKQVKAYPDASNVSNFITENYAYSGGAEINSVKNYTYIMTLNHYNDIDVFGSSTPLFPNYQTKGGVVGYRTVKVSKTGIGKSIYTYRTPTEVANESSLVYQVGVNGTGVDIYPYTEPLDKDWQRGLMEESKVTLDDETKILSQESYTYNVAPSNFTSTTVYGLTAAVYNYDGFDQYRAGLHKYQTSWYFLQTQVSKEFNGENPGDVSKALITTATTNYDVKLFGGRQYTFLKSQTRTGPDNIVWKTEYRYPLDIDAYGSAILPSTPVANALLKMSRRTDDKVMLNSPIEIIRYRGSDITESLIQTYKGFPDGSDIIRPYQSFLLETSVPLSIYKKFTVDSGVTDYISKDDKSILRNSFDRYDDVGNLQQYTTVEGVVITILYGYSKTYPVAEIKNATFNDVVNVLGQTTIDNLNTNPGTDDELRLKLLPLRTAGSLVNAFITTYTYAPLVGQTSMTDANNVTTYYEYDDLNRLKFIKDFDKNVLKAFDYNYQK